MQCVILAGGLGTRMWPRARTVPKTMLPVAGHPFAHWQLRWLADSGVTSVVYCVGYLGSQVRDYVADGAAWGLQVDYVDEGAALRGTAGALRLALDQGVLQEHFLVLYGDSYLQIDPAAVHAAAITAGAPALMTVYENSGRWDTSNVVLEGDRVRRYDKGVSPVPTEMRWIDYGLSVIERDLVARRVVPDEVADLAPVMATLAHQGDLAAYLATERFYEIGSPEGLAEVEEALAGSA